MLHIPLTKTMVNAQERITFSISITAQAVLGLDDPVLVKEAYPSLDRVERNIFRATREDARTICSDLNERSDASEQGFGHTASERRASRTAARKLYDQLFAK